MSCFVIILTMRIVLFVIGLLIISSPTLAEEERLSDMFFKEGYWLDEQGHSIKIHTNVLPDRENGTGIIVSRVLESDRVDVDYYKIIKQFDDKILMLTKTIHSDHRVSYDFYLATFKIYNENLRGSFSSCSWKDSKIEYPHDIYTVLREEFQYYKPFDISKYKTLFPKFFATDGQDESEISCSYYSNIFMPFDS